MKSRVDLGLEKKFSIVAALFFGVSLASFVAIRGYAYADSTTSASASVVVPDVCSISSTTTGHNATVAVGTSRTDIGTTDISVICNDNDGFSVYATGYSNDTAGNTNLIGVVSGLTIPTGTSSDASVSNWSMKISPVTGNYTPTVLSDANGSYASYHIIPSTTTKVVTRTSAINVSSASEFRTTYAVAVAPAQTADTYVGKVKYTVVHPNYSNADGSLESYPVNLSFGANTSSIVIDSVAYTSSSAAPELEHGTHTISATFPSGYELDSWSTTGNVSIANSTSNPTTITVTGEGTVTVVGKANAMAFQNATSADCGKFMYDDRGTAAYKSITYTTATINGLCWMTRNLDLPGGTTLTPADSNVATNYTLPASGADGFYDYTIAYVYNSNSTICGDNSPCYSYYSYAAATAGTNPSASDAASDICPKGWRLPTKAEYDTLIGTYTTGAALTVSPFNGVYAGRYSSGSFGYGGSGGDYWSSTAANKPTSSACYLYFDSSSAGTSCNHKSYGYSIRCVAK